MKKKNGKVQNLLECGTNNVIYSLACMAKQKGGIIKLLHTYTHVPYTIGLVNTHTHTHTHHIINKQCF
jgi:hypothetical protein